MGAQPKYIGCIQHKPAQKKQNEKHELASLTCPWPIYNIYKGDRYLCPS